MKELRILGARQEDFEAVFNLLSQLWPGKHLDREKILKVYLQALESEWQRYLVAVVSERVVGFLSLRMVNNLWAQGILMQIEELVVDESYRGLKIGSCLVMEAVQLAENLCCASIEVTSAEHRKQAHTFYEKNGFEKKAFHFIRPITMSVWSLQEQTTETKK